MRSTYGERLIRFSEGLLAAALLLSLLLQAAPGSGSGRPTGELLLPALWATLGQAGISLLLGLPLALLLGVPAGLRPHSLLDRLLQGFSVVLMGLPAFAAGVFGILLLAVEFRLFSISGAAQATLVLLLAGWVARAIRNGVADVCGDGGPVDTGRAIIAAAGRVLQQTGTILVISMVLAVVGGGQGAGLWGLVIQAVPNRDVPLLYGALWAVAACALVGHLAGDLLVTAAGSRRPEGRLSPGWVLFGGLLLLPLVVALLLGGGGNAVAIDLAHRLLPPGAGHPLGTDTMGRDLLARVGVGARTSLMIAAAATLAAAVGGAALASIGRATGRWGAALFSPRVPVPGFLGPLVAGLGGALLLRPSTATLILSLGVASIPAMGWAFRRLFLQPAKQVWALLGLTLLTFAQIFMVESILSFYGLGVMPPTPSLGGVAMDAVPHIRSAPHLLYGTVPAVLALVGLFLVGHAFLEVAPAEE